jgi:hypothetical protein
MNNKNIFFIASFAFFSITASEGLTYEISTYIPIKSRSINVPVLINIGSQYRYDLSVFVDLSDSRELSSPNIVRKDDCISMTIDHTKTSLSLKNQNIHSLQIQLNKEQTNDLINAIKSMYSFTTIKQKRYFLLARYNDPITWNRSYQNSHQLNDFIFKLGPQEIQIILHEKSCIPTILAGLGIAGLAVLIFYFNLHTECVRMFSYNAKQTL